jgi:hypothetical protein
MPNLLELVRIHKPSYNQERDEKLNVVSINRAQADNNTDKREE